jgi:pilus assembly protein CpaC
VSPPGPQPGPRPGPRSVAGLAALLLGLAAVIASGAGAPARAGQPGIADSRAGAVLDVPVGKSEVLRLDRAFAKALVGNPEVADVIPVTLSSVYVLGKAAGTTNLTLYDRRGQLIAVVDVVVGADTQGLKRQLAQTFPGETVSVGTSNDRLMIEGQVSSPLVAERIAAMAESFAPEKVLNLLSVGSPQQVLLEVRFAEMSRGTAKQLGINAFVWANSSSEGVISVPQDNTFGPFRGEFTLFGPQIAFQLDALERKGLIHTLAQPNLIALSGETANFLAGGEFPIPVAVSTTTGVPTVSLEFKQFGVSLAFTPTVLGDGLINLVVAPEVSSLDRDVSVQLSGFNIPGLKVRRARTVLELRDGQSFALAGLIQSDFTDTVRAVPLLGRIPIIGALFRSSSFQRNETELVIMVTPRLVRPVKPSQIALPTDRVLQPSDTDLFLLGKSERKGTPPAIKPGGIDGEFGHIVR